MSKDREEDLQKLKYERLTSDQDIKNTLDNLGFPLLDSSEKIETFFSAIKGGSGYNADCIKLEQIIGFSRKRTRLALEAIRNVLHSKNWRDVDPHHDKVNEDYQSR